MKTRLFESRGLRVEAQRGPDGWGFYVWRPHVSVFFLDRKELIRWTGYSKGLPTRVALDEWLDSLNQGKAPNLEQDPTLLKETTWGPEAHEDDPTANTKMIT
jgi:hypothetical protein